MMLGDYQKFYSRFARIKNRLSL